MSKSHFVEVKLGINYSENNMMNLLKKAENAGVIFYDHILGVRYEDSPTLNVDHALQKLIKNMQDCDADHSLFLEIPQKSYTHLWFYNNEGLLEFHLGSFVYLKEKHFEDSITQIDFEFYIDFALKIARDFGIQKLVADSID